MAKPDQPVLPPIPSFSIVTVVVSILVLGAAIFSSMSPWLGLVVEPDGELGLKVVVVDAQGPLASVISPDEHLLSIRNEKSGTAVSLRNYDPAGNPHAATQFEGYANYMQYQGLVASPFRSGAIVLERGDGSLVTVNPHASRTLLSLPANFWLLNLFGAIACIISISVWMFRPGRWPAKLLALSGVGFFLATLLHSIWETRELALPSPIFEALMRGNHVGLHLLFVSLLILMILYPRPLPGAKWLVSSTLLFAVLQQVNENLQIWNLPLHTFYLPLAIYYIAGVFAAVMQWWQARHHPLDRGALRWMFLSILIAMGGGMLVYFLPTMIGLPPLSSLVTMVGIASTLYVGFALGILRYKLFQIERWWFIAWVWFFAGVMVLVVDLLVVSSLGVNQQYALTFSLLAVGWLYLPFRQWLWRRLLPSTEVYIEQYLPGFVESLFTSAPGEEGEHWRNMLLTVFQPLALDDVQDNHVKHAALINNGAQLLVPCFDEHATGLRLLYAQRGKRLFNVRDRNLAEALGAVAYRVSNLREARLEGASQERKRIMRDLHDDVGGRLLTLMHTATEERNAKLARGALSALRETIYALDDKRRYNLQDMLEEFRSELDERITTERILVRWSGTPPKDSITLPPRYFINLRRMLSEAVSNVLEHAANGEFFVTFAVKNDCIDVQLENVIQQDSSDQSSTLRGRGLHNMQTRISELDGEIALFCSLSEPPRFCLHATVPLPADNLQLVP